MKEARTCVLQEEMCKFIFALTCVCIMPNDKSKNIEVGSTIQKKNFIIVYQAEANNSILIYTILH